VVPSGFKRFGHLSFIHQFKKKRLASQPPIERVSDISKNWIFDDPFHKKGPVLVVLVSGMIQPSGSGSF
jgi:hypothetical protein